MTSFREVWPESGGDDETSTPGLMVPLNKWNFMYLEDGDGLKFDYERDKVELRRFNKRSKHAALILINLREGLHRNDPTWMDVLEPLAEFRNAARSGYRAVNSLLLGFRGKKAGYVRFKALDRKTRHEKARLIITVHPPKTLKVSFNFLRARDAGGKERNLTRWSPSDAKGWVEDLNDIFAPQTNIALKMLDARWVVATGKLGPTVSRRDWGAIGRLRDANADLNVFLVGSWLGSDQRDPNGEYIRETKDAVCDDRPSRSLLLQTMSHEIGHHLGAGHAVSRKASKQHWLMASSPRAGNKIIHEWALKMNNPWD